MSPYVRAAGCRLLEKMETDPGYSRRLSLKDESTFCEIPVTQIRRDQKQSRQVAMTAERERK
jgi:hypothetical protein